MINNLLNKAVLLCILNFLITPLAHASCSVGGSINFGIYNTLESNDTLSTGELNVSCTTSSSFSLGLGTGQSGNYLNRTLTDGGSEKLNYNLFTNTARTAVFGDGSGSTSNVNQSISSGSISVPIYGDVPARQNVSSGSYMDTVAVYITF
jgi:spore coat protein U-like protein